MGGRSVWGLDVFEMTVRSWTRDSREERTWNVSETVRRWEHDLQRKPSKLRKNKPAVLMMMTIWALLSNSLIGSFSAPMKMLAKFLLCIEWAPSWLRNWYMQCNANAQHRLLGVSWLEHRLAYLHRREIRISGQNKNDVLRREARLVDCLIMNRSKVFWSEAQRTVIHITDFFHCLYSNIDSLVCINLKFNTRKNFIYLVIGDPSRLSRSGFLFAMKCNRERLSREFISDGMQKDIGALWRISWEYDVCHCCVQETN